MIQIVCLKLFKKTFSIMAPTTTKTAKLLELAKKGPLRTRDLASAGIPRVYLKRLTKSGVLERIDRGLYRLAGAPMTATSSLVEVSKRLPQAVIGLLSALQFHGMTTEAPHAVWVLIEGKARMPKVFSPKIEVVRASGNALMHGVEHHVIEGVTLRLTTPAKTVADCFRFRRHVGLEVALHALRDYLRHRKGSMEELIDAARASRAQPFMRPYMEALA